MRVGVVFHRFGPYHCARLRAATELATVVGIELSAETREYDWSKVEHAFSFSRTTIVGQGDSRDLRASDLASRVEKSLTEVRPTVVALPGWSDRGSLAALRWCIREGVPVILMSESSEHDEKRTWWKEVIKQQLVALFSSALVGGESHKAYLSKLGMPSDKVFFGYDVVDNAFFAERAAIARAHEGKVRKELQLPNKYFLVSARFIEKKNLPRLLHAYAQYRKSNVRDLWDLVVLGDGPLRTLLLRIRTDLGLEGSVHFAGFKQYPELPSYYGLAGAFVHVSTTEQWGLVVNEALACGLPVVVSQTCGCVPELVTHGVNGFVCDPSDVDELANALRTVSAPETDRREMGKQGERIIDGFSPKYFAHGLLKAAECALAQPITGSMTARLTLGALLL